MADPDRDTRVSERYRALAREEPPPELDAAILAAARRRRARWAVPVSIAAVVVLAVGVTLRVQIEERKDAEQIALSPQVMQAPAPADELARQARRDAAPARAPAAAAPPVALESRAQDAPEALVGKREAPAEAEAGRAEPAGRASANVAVGKLSAAPETPEQWLERIAKLREAAKAREADASLAEFRKRYPDYKMSEAMRARVAPR
ncbi:MAG: hypothetical protein OEW96_12875 [Betaproteobacteria bacterium]|nr:hypothetical protein [Betaproteobacteria bacterium]MDH5212555.1 hypothetical protein [Betaproteobacteria bacterium]